MADIIRLLPDAIANQIAAGEVIQRPASVVKELMENAIDAGADQVKVIIKDAGKTLIQIIDNGCGMSETDARLSFERHATSKIREAQDLFSIRTMGFRGEALASIAAVAQVEMRTRLHNEELGTRIHIEDSKVNVQEPCQCVAGTTFSVKNLFYNVPARRNFLKSPNVEMRHIVDEFQRIALAHPEVFFSLHHNNQEMYHLPSSNLRQRIVGVFGSSSNKKLVPVDEDTDILQLHGFVGKPEFAKKSRGEQFFFVNRRFIRSNYLNHAVTAAYEGILQQGTYPFYVIFLNIDPTHLDVNVHPTKQEIKFDDERLVYNYLKVAVRHALGQHSVTPTLDFDQEAHLMRPTGFSPESGSYRLPPIQNPETARQQSNLENWQKMYEGLGDGDPGEDSGNLPQSLTIESSWSAADPLESGSSKSGGEKKPYQLHNSYIVSPIKSGFLLIDQQAAHERILYERYLEQLKNKQAAVQQELFPRTLDLSPGDANLLQEILPEINGLGFDVQSFGQDSFVIHGIPADLPPGQDTQALIETLIDQYKLNTELKLDVNENIARSMARSGAVRKGSALDVTQMQAIIDKLFACEMPFKSPGGRNCFITFDFDELDKKFAG
jgi:DNA mismatch repair protein MutL